MRSRVNLRLRKSDAWGAYGARWLTVVAPATIDERQATPVEPRPSYPSHQHRIPLDALE